jgi:hypothetical protein
MCSLVMMSGYRRDVGIKDEVLSFPQHNPQRGCHGKGRIDLATLRIRGRDTPQSCRYELPEASPTDGTRAQHPHH